MTDFSATFSDHTRNDLKNICKLSDEIIDELEEIAAVERAHLQYKRTQPTARGRREALKSLRSNTSALLHELRNLHPTMEIEISFQGFLGFKDLANRIQELNTAVTKLPLTHDKAGNKELDQTEIVRRVARVLTNHGIQVRKRGNDFRDILNLVFGEEEARSVPHAIEKAWPFIKHDIEFPEDYWSTEPE